VNLLKSFDLNENNFFFISGFPKTGTTVLMHTLNHFNKIVCKGESRIYFNEIENSYSLYEEIKKGVSSWLSIVGPRKSGFFFDEKDIKTIGEEANSYNIIENRIFEEKSEDISSFLTHQIFQYIRNIYDKNIFIGEKTPFTSSEKFSLFLNKTKPAKKIIMYRDFLDFFTSFCLANYKTATTHTIKPILDRCVLENKDLVIIDEFIKNKLEPGKFIREKSIDKYYQEWIRLYELAENDSSCSVFKFEDFMDNNKKIDILFEILKFIGITDIDLNENDFIFNPKIFSSNVRKLSIRKEECFTKEQLNTYI
jgi:hypothetical protein